MYNDIDGEILDKIILKIDTEDIIIQILEDKVLSNKIVERVLINQYVKALEIQHYRKQKYYNSLLIEVNEQIKNLIYINKTNEQIYQLITKVDCKIDAILFHNNIYKKEDKYELYVIEHIKFIVDNLSSSEIIIKDKYIKQLLTKKLVYTKKLKSYQKRMLLEDAVCNIKNKN